MGGNVFKDNKRMESKQEFYSVYGKQHKFLSSNNIHEFIELPRQIESKTSFGDMDLVVNINKLETYKSKLIAAGYPVSRNGIVLSYQTPEKYQIDLIGIDKNKLNYALRYFSFGDHGNILGKLISYHFSLKHSFNGLYYSFVKDSGNFKNNIFLSLDYVDALDLLGLSHYKFIEGFATEEEIFEWIYESPLMNTEIYSFDKMTNRDATRDRKRKFYNSWLDFLKTKEPKVVERLTKEERDNILEKNFEGFKQVKDSLEMHYKLLCEYREKFNGNIVKEISGFEGKKLGNLMKNLKELLPEYKVRHMTSEEVKDFIKNQLTFNLLIAIDENDLP